MKFRKIGLTLLSILFLGQAALGGTNLTGTGDPSIDAPALQNAINGGGTVRLTGTFDITGYQLDVTNSVELVGSTTVSGVLYTQHDPATPHPGDSRTYAATIKYTAAATDDGVIKINIPNEGLLEVDGLRIEGTGASASMGGTNGYGVFTRTDNGNLSLTDCHVQGDNNPVYIGKTAGQWGVPPMDLTVERCFLEVNASGGSYQVVSANGTKSGGVREWLIEDSVVIKDTSLGENTIAANYSSGTINIQGCYVDGGGWIAVYSSRATNKPDHQVTNLRGNTIVGTCLPRGAQGPIIENNSLYRLHAVTLVTYQTEDAIIRNNTFDDQGSRTTTNLAHLRLIGGGASGALVADNVFKGSGFSGWSCVVRIVMDSCILEKNDYREADVDGFTSSQGQGCIRLRAGRTWDCLVFEQGGFPQGTNALDQVRDEGINNRVVGHPADDLAQQEQMNPGIGQRLQDADAQANE
jgi:hypothetical protein